MRVCLFFFFICLSSFSQIVINEIDVDNPSNDTQEFVELKSDTPNYNLNGYVLVFFNGSTSGNDSSYFAVDLDGAITDVNGLLLIGATTVSPTPQVIIPAEIIQNGADAVAIYRGNDTDFPEGTRATQTDLVDAIVYDTSDPDDVDLMALLGVTEQINEGASGNTDSIQRNNDGTYSVDVPTPGLLNDGTGISINSIEISTVQTMVSEGEAFDITFTTANIVTSDYTFSFSLANEGFTNADFTGNTVVTIPSGSNTITTNIQITDDLLDEGDEELLIAFDNLPSPVIAFNDLITVRVVDNDFTTANFGTPINPTYGNVTSTQPSGYYDGLNGLSENALAQAIQDLISDETMVRAQTYADVFDILEEADENPENSNEVWLVYSEEGRPKLDVQSGSDSNGKWNREHTFPRSLAGYFSIEDDDFNDGINVFWETHADSLRHGNSDAHALRVADGPENSARGNKHYGQYNGPTGNAGSFKGDVARSVLYMQLRYSGLSIQDGFPDTVGQMGDLATLLDWHRNDPPDDFEMHRNNVIYNWQFNRNPLIDLPDLVEYIWGNQVGNTWNPSLSADDFITTTLQIYPNPVRDTLYIAGNESNYSVTIYSMDGKEILKTKVAGNNAIDLKISSGLYILMVSSGNANFNQKIVVK